MSNTLKGTSVPEEPLVVRTIHSLYRIGPADDAGERIVIKEGEDGKPLPFSRGKIVLLAEGKRMQVVWPGAAHGKAWTTSMVESIIIGQKLA